MQCPAVPGQTAPRPEASKSASESSKSSQRFLDYNMNLDGQDLAVDDPESRGLSVFRVGKRNNEMRRFGIISPRDVCLRRLGRAMRMRMKNGNQFLPALTQVPHDRNQLGGIHFEFLRFA